MAKHHQRTCNCNAYGFPHRAGSGKCDGETRSHICLECKHTCHVRTEDDRFSYEYGSIRGVHGSVYLVSTCCDAGVEEAPKTYYAPVVRRPAAKVAA